MSKIVKPLQSIRIDTDTKSKDLIVKIIHVTQELLGVYSYTVSETKQNHWSIQLKTTLHTKLSEDTLINVLAGLVNLYQGLVLSYEDQSCEKTNEHYYWAVAQL